MATASSANVIAGPDASKVNKDSIGSVDANPSGEISRKRQSLSDLFTIVGSVYPSQLNHLFG